MQHHRTCRSSLCATAAHHCTCSRQSQHWKAHAASAHELPRPGPERRRLLQAAFKREVAETVLRCAAQGFDPGFAVVELNGLKIAEDKTFADCASAILTTLLGMCFPAPPRTKPDNAALYPGTAADVSSQVGPLPWPLDCPAKGGWSQLRRTPAEGWTARGARPSASGTLRGCCKIP